MNNRADDNNSKQENKSIPDNSLKHEPVSRCLLILRIRLELNLPRQTGENKGWHRNISKVVCTKNKCGFEH